MHSTTGAGTAYTAGAGATEDTAGAGAMYSTIGAGVMYFTTGAGLSDFKTASVDTHFPCLFSFVAWSARFKDGKCRHTFSTVFSTRGTTGWISKGTLRGFKDKKCQHTRGTICKISKRTSLWVPKGKCQHTFTTIHSTCDNTGQIPVHSNATLGQKAQLVDGVTRCQVEGSKPMPPMLGGGMLLGNTSAPSHFTLMVWSPYR